MDVEQLKEDVLRGQITLDRLIEVVVTSQRELQAAKQGLDQTKQELDQAKRRIAELEQQLGGSPTQKVSEPFSLRAEEQRQQARGKKRRKRKRRSRGGRRTTAEKIAQAVRTEKVFPAGVPEADCRLSHTRPVWRLENGQAVLVAYEIYRGPKNQYGKIPGVFGRSEFGIGNRAGHRVSGVRRRAVVRQGLPADELLPAPETAEVAGQRPVEPVGAAVGRGVRSAVHAAGKLAGGAYRRDGLEHQQRVGISLGEGACVVFRRA